jgi:membrane fusion protein (multidrug efflux system)
VKQWEDCTVRAPVGGYVAARDASVSKGSFLNRGVRVARIVDLAVLRAEIAVGEREVGQVREGVTARVAVAGQCAPGEFDAVVKAVAAGADPGSGSFRVVVEWNNTCGSLIKSGMTATVTIPSAGQDTVVVVPTAALVVRDGRDAVLVAAGDRTVVRPVRKGRVAGNRTHILEGLAEGEVVIMSALGTLGPNDPVTVTLVGQSGTWR